MVLLLSSYLFSFLQIYKFIFSLWVVCLLAFSQLAFQSGIANAALLLSNI